MHTVTIPPPTGLMLSEEDARRLLTTLARTRESHDPGSFEQELHAQLLGYFATKNHLEVEH